MKRLRNSDFVNFEEQKDFLENLIMLYDTRIPKEKIEHEGTKYSLDEPFEVNLSGHVSDPSRAIARSLLNSYEFTLMKTHQAKGFLFVYVDFAQGSDSDSKQLIYKVFPLL